jgi:hypothetical protein
MTYSDARKSADIAPLADAISAIRDIVSTHSYTSDEVDERESDHDILVEMLDQIDDQVKCAREGGGAK